MAEAILTQCDTCEVIYDKVKSPDCPNRMARRRRHAQAKKKKAAAKKGAAASKVRGAPAGELDLAGQLQGPGGLKGEWAARTDDLLLFDPRPSAAQQRIRRSRVSRVGAARLRMLSRALVVFLLGAVSHQVAVNVAMERPILDPPVAVLTVAMPYELPVRQARAAGTADTAVANDPFARGAVELGSLQAERDFPNGIVHWTGVLTNHAEVTLDRVRVTLTAVDADGKPVAEHTSLVQPSRIAPGERALVRAHIPMNDEILEWRFRAHWLQPTEVDLATETLLAASP